MDKKPIFGYLIIIVFLTFGSLFAQSKVGTSAANFLQIGVGARGTAIGDAGTTTYQDLSAIYWNPALAASAPSNQVYFNHTRWFADIDLNYGAALLNLGNIGNFALSFYSLTTDQIEVTTEIYQNGTGELYTVADIMVGLSYARALTDNFMLGATAKYISETIWNSSATAFALDVGFTYQTPFKSLLLAMSMSNFGTEMQMQGTDLAARFDPDETVHGNNDGIIVYQKTNYWDLPIILRFGLAYTVISNDFMKLSALGDVLYPSSNENFVNAGIEYSIKDTYFLRAGHRQLFLDDAEGGLSFGAGLKFNAIQIDYAYSDRGVLNEVQYFSIAFNF